MTMRNNNGNSAIPDVHNTRPSLACGQQPESGRPRHECGVCGIFGHEDAAKLTYFGLYALQHRGQAISAGMAVFGIDTEEIYDLIEYADFAMYQAKRNGKNRYSRFDPSEYEREKGEWAN